ncbi:hypothetical protein PAXRUDRAFT_96019, partial [Paxillus rubicundulus Ve08.2h10]
EITGEPKAKMQWAYYFQNITQCYMVIVEGWPDSIPFANLSSVTSSLPQLEMLQCKWEMGTTYWKKLTEGKYSELRQKCNEQLESSELMETSCHTHSDKGKKCSHRSTEDLDDTPHGNKKYKSVETIE